jgi:hypothetical protein
MVARIKFKELETLKPDYALKPNEQAAIQKPASGLANNTTPGLKVVDGQVEIDHPDKLIGMLLMMDAFATSDPAFVHGLLGQIGRACISEGHRAESEMDVNFVLSVIKDHKPRNQNGAMLAAHIGITNLGAMNAARLRTTARSLEQFEMADRMYNKSTKSALDLSEGVKRLQSSGEPSVTVQNVSVSDGGQAIVGNVTQNSATAAQKTAPSPLAITHVPMIEMPIIENRASEVVPFKPKSRK